jgi:hypothetical protein
LTLAPRSATKDYNWEAENSYEIFKLKMSAASATTVKGFTLHNYGDMSAQDYVKNVEVMAGSEKLSKVKASFNRDDELVISFDGYEIAANKNATFTVKASLSDDFDEYGKFIAFGIADADDINAVESKTSARAGVSTPVASTIVKVKYNTTSKKYE